jgi:hypothetical protein
MFQTTNQIYNVNYNVIYIYVEQTFQELEVSAVPFRAIFWQLF